MSKPVVVIVDDDELQRGLLSAFLQKRHDVRIAENGTEMWRILEECGERVTAFLMDLALPETTGLELAVELRGDPRWDRTPIVAVTALEAEAACAAALDAGCDDYVLKPYDRNDLERRLAEAIAARRAAP